MKGKIDFEYDESNDIVIATLHWRIESLEDVEVWYNQWVDYMSKFDKKMDTVMILNDFYVKAGVSVEWGQSRAKLVGTYTRFSYRVNPDLSTGIFIRTSGSRYNVSTGEANSLQAAKDAIFEDRKKAGIS
jgi:hypothetical protein